MIPCCQIYNKYDIPGQLYLLFAHKLSDHLLGILPPKIPTLHREMSKFSSSMKENNLGKKPTLLDKILITFEICLNPRVSDFIHSMVQYGLIQ